MESTTLRKNIWLNQKNYLFKTLSLMLIKVTLGDARMSGEHNETRIATLLLYKDSFIYH